MFKKIRCLAICFLLIALSQGSAAYAETKRTVTLGMEDSFPPYARADGTGMAPELIRAAYAAVGVDVKFEVKPYARILEEVESGALVGGFGVAKQPTTENKFIFGTEPLFIVKSHFFTKKGTRLYKKGTHQPAQKPEDLGSQERVGLINGYEYGEAVEKNTHILVSRVNTQKQNLDKLLAPIPRLDAVVYFENEAADLFREEIAAQRLKQGDVVPAFESTPSIIHVAFSKKHPQTEMDVKFLDQGLKIIRNNGLYKKISDSYQPL